MGFGLSRETTMKRHEISLSVPTPSVVRSTRVSIQGKGATKTTANCSTSCSHFATLLTNVAHVATSQYSGCARLLSKNLKGIKSIFQLQNQVLAQFQAKKYYKQLLFTLPQSLVLSKHNIFICWSRHEAKREHVWLCSFELWQGRWLTKVSNYTRRKQATVLQHCFTTNHFLCELDKQISI